MRAYGNRALSGRFCSRQDSRSIAITSNADRIVAFVDLVKSTNPDILTGDGTGSMLLVVHDGRLDAVCLSRESREVLANGGEPVEGEKGRKGRCCGRRQDPHNVRKAIRRWLVRNPDMVEAGLALQVTRTDRGVILNAVPVEA